MNRVKLRGRTLVLGLLLCLTALHSEGARADVGVPPAQPASSLSPGDLDTDVQMVSEEVRIVIDQPHKASVTAEFQMRNNGEDEEAIEVWFPFGERLTYEKGPSQISVHDFQAWVNGDKVEIAIENSDEWLIFWAHWPVSFPPGTPVLIQVHYTVDVDRHGLPGWFDHYSYILETGAGWQGAIEEALITIEAPYPLQELDEFLGGPAFYASPAGYSVSGSTVLWDLQDLEPTAEDNIDFRFFIQDRWIALRTGVEALENHPDDWQVYADLASALNIWMLAQQSVVQAGLADQSPKTAELEVQIAWAFWEALQFAPNDPSPYIGAIQYFRWHPELIDSRDLHEVYYLAAERFPGNQQIQEYYQEALKEGWIGEGPPPSSTPLPPTITPTVPAPAPTAVPEEQGGPGHSTALILLAGLSLLSGAVLLIILGFRWRRE